MTSLYPMKVSVWALITLFFLNVSVNSAQAQDALTIYKKAVDEINCATTKLLLAAYDRPATARKIKSCTYSEITGEVKTIEEKTIKGYKKLILDVANDINSYKNKIENPVEYSLYEDALANLTTETIENFSTACVKYRTEKNGVCQKLDKKVASLKSDFNKIKALALTNIKRETYNANNTATDNNNNEPVEEVRAIPSTSPETVTDNTTNQETNNITAVNNNEGERIVVKDSSKGTSMWYTLIIIVLAALVAWLYKGQTELKEQMEDIKMLLKILNKKK